MMKRIVAALMTAALLVPSGALADDGRLPRDVLVSLTRSVNAPVLVAAKALHAESGVSLWTDGPLTPIANLRGRTNENGYLIVAAGAAGVTDGPLTPIGNLRGRTNENGYLIVALTGGTIQFTGDGDCSAPPITFVGDIDTGLDRLGANNIALCTSGTTRVDINTARILSTLPLLFTADNTVDIGAAGATRPRTGYFGTSVVTGSNTYGANISGTMNIQFAAGSYINWAGRLTLRAPADGYLTLLNEAETAFSLLQFGGTTSSFPALKRSTTTLQVRLGDDSAYGNADALGYLRGGVVTISGTAPTIASGGCTSPAVTWANGTAAFALTVGTSCGGVQTMTLTLPAATNGWACFINNNTAPETFRLVATSTTTTAVVIKNYSATLGTAADFTASQVLVGGCTGG